MPTPPTPPTPTTSPTPPAPQTPPGSYNSPCSIDASAVPPIVPPHLLQVILNDPDKANATILPQPNHVMLNHLYALSIKDGIMVLSATHRFRKKYVTTLLYKPI
uniref:5'-AMP-activated protein kinase subunit beta-1 n=1 Tax=Aceria tosichella TaxID=561515 RepID=A0A6G1SHB2_9ACAR